MGWQAKNYGRSRQEIFDLYQMRWFSGQEYSCRNRLFRAVRRVARTSGGSAWPVSPGALRRALFALVRKRCLEDATLELGILGRTLSAVTFCTRREQRRRVRLVVLPSSLMKSSEMPGSLSLPASAPLAAPKPAPSAMPASGGRNRSPIRVCPRARPIVPPSERPCLHEQHRLVKVNLAVSGAKAARQREDAGVDPRAHDHGGQGQAGELLFRCGSAILRYGHVRCRSHSVLPCGHPLRPGNVVEFAGNTHRNDVLNPGGHLTRAGSDAWRRSSRRQWDLDRAGLLAHLALCASPPVPPVHATCGTNHARLSRGTARAVTSTPGCTCAVLSRIEGAEAIAPALAAWRASSASPSGARPQSAAPGRCLPRCGRGGTGRRGWRTSAAGSPGCTIKTPPRPARRSCPSGYRNPRGRSGSAPYSESLVRKRNREMGQREYAGRDRRGRAARRARSSRRPRSRAPRPPRVRAGIRDDGRAEVARRGGSRRVRSGRRRTTRSRDRAWRRGQVEQHELAAVGGQMPVQRGDDRARADREVDDRLEGKDRAGARPSRPLRAGTRSPVAAPGSAVTTGARR